MEKEKSSLFLISGTKLDIRDQTIMTGQVRFFYSFQQRREVMDYKQLPWEAFKTGLDKSPAALSDLIVDTA